MSSARRAPCRPSGATGHRDPNPVPDHNTPEEEPPAAATTMPVRMTCPRHDMATPNTMAARRAVLTRPLTRTECPCGRRCREGRTRRPAGEGCQSRAARPRPGARGRRGSRGPDVPGAGLGGAEDADPFVDLAFELVGVDEAVDPQRAEEVADARGRRSARGSPAAARTAARTGPSWPRSTRSRGCRPSRPGSSPCGRPCSRSPPSGCSAPPSIICRGSSVAGARRCRSPSRPGSAAACAGRSRSCRRPWRWSPCR